MFKEMRRRGFSLDPSCKIWIPFYRYGAEQSKSWDYSGNDNHGVITGAVQNPGISMIVPLTSMKISAGAGTSFVDLGIAGSLTTPGRRVVIKSNTTGAQISGYIGAVGVAETLDVELLTDWPTHTYETFTHAGITVTSAIDLAGLEKYAISNNVPTVVGTLYKYTVALTLNSGTAPYSAVRQGDNLDWDSPLARLVNGANNIYFTSKTIGASGWIKLVNTEVSNFAATFSRKKVLTPSATGCTIVSTRGGATQSWESKDATFNYADTAGYTVYFEGEVARGEYLDGTDDRIVHPAVNLAKAHTLHYWIKRIGTNGIVHGGAVDYNGLRISDTTVGYSAGAGTAAAETHNGAISTATKTLMSVIRLADKVTFFQNGVQLGTEQTMGGAPGDLELTDIGRFSNGTIYFNGIIYEIVCFNDNKGFVGVRNFFEMTRRIQGV